MDFDDLLQELDRANSPMARKELLERLRGLKTDDDALSGVLLFLADNNWDLDTLQMRLGAIDKTTPHSSRSNKAPIVLRTTLKYAAALLLPLAAWGVYQLLSRPSDIDRYYVEEPGLPNLMGSNSQTLWSDAMASFRKGDYELTLKELDAVNHQESNDTLLYFKAVANYEIKEYAKAATYFHELADESSSIFRYDAEFRMAFTLYKNGKFSESKLLFETIASNQNHPYFEEAKRVMSEVFERE